MNRRAFTLIELLVVIAIIALLTSILLPSLQGAKRAARAMTCLTQMRTIGHAILFYANDNNEFLPRSSHSALASGFLPWGYALCPYVGYGKYEGSDPAWNRLFNSLYRCPEDPRRDNKWSYGKNVWPELKPSEMAEVTGKSYNPSFARLCDIPRLDATIILGEIKSGAMADHAMAHFWYMGGEVEVDALRHYRNSQYVYLDGHAVPIEFKNTFDEPKKIDQWNPATAK